MAGNQTVLVAARNVSADRKPASTGGYKSLLTGRPDSTRGCQSALVDKLEVSPSQYHHPWSTSQSPGDKQKAHRGRISETSVSPHYSQSTNEVDGTFAPVIV
jgi:hypothetical protein